MSTQQKRIYELCSKHLKSLPGGGGPHVTLDIAGPSLVIANAPNGAPIPTVGWNILLTMENQTLVNKPTHAIHVSIGGHLPPDDDFTSLVEKCLDKAIELDEEMMKPQQDEIPEALKSGHVSSGSSDRPKSKPRERPSHFKHDPDSKFGPLAESDE